MSQDFVVAIAIFLAAAVAAFVVWRIVSLSRAVQNLELAGAHQHTALRNYLAAFDYSPLALVVVRRRDLAIVNANGAAERLFGFALEEVVGTPFGTIGLFARRADMERSRQAIVDAETLQDIDASMYHRDGSLLNVRYTTVPVTHDGEDATLIGYDDWTDIIELKRSREMLRGQLHHLQKNETVNTLVSGVAHDFNNILGIVMGFAELSRRELAPDHPARDFLAEIESASQRARDLVTQLMNYSRRGDSEHAPLDLAGLAEESVRFLTAALPPDIEIHAEIRDEEAYIEGNAAELQQVLLNLMTNAAHAMDNRGDIHIELRRFVARKNFRVTSGILRRGTYRTISIRDGGIGIEPDVVPRIFDPFFTTKDIGEGSGLGLAVAHNIVLEHGGGIMVDSVAGAGSVFTVLLPSLDDAAQPEDDADTGAGSTMTIASDQSTVERTCDWLNTAGIPTTPMVDPRIALQTLADDAVSPACVLIGELDDDVDALELATRIARTVPGTPIVTLAPAATPEMLERTGLSGTVTKLNAPRMPGEIVAAVRAAIAGRAPSAAGDRG